MHQLIVETENESSSTLSEIGDNTPIIQAAIDAVESVAGRKKITIPPGTWKLGSSLELVSDLELVLKGVTLEPLDPETFQGALIYAGASGQGHGTRARCDRVKITGGILNQTAATSASCHGLFCDVGDDWHLVELKCTNSKHEGLVSGGATSGWLWERCEADDCGEGSVHRAASGAGINCNGHNHTLIDCTTRRCGQGYEHGGSKTQFLRCQALDGLIPSPSFVGPARGFNLGNAGMGLYRTSLIQCRSTGHIEAMIVGNAIGRCSGIFIDGFCGENGEIAVTLGRVVNNPSGEWDGPADEPCSINRSKLRFTSPSYGGIGVNTGNGVVNWVEYILPPWTFSDCACEFDGVSPASQGAPPYGVTGSTNGVPVVFNRCGVAGLDVSPSRGDFQHYAFGANVSPTSGHIKTIDCWSTKADGSPRWFRPNRDFPE